MVTTAATGQFEPVTVRSQAGGSAEEANRASARAMLLRFGVCNMSPLPLRNLYKLSNSVLHVLLSLSVVAMQRSDGPACACGRFAANFCFLLSLIT